MTTQQPTRLRCQSVVLGGLAALAFLAAAAGSSAGIQGSGRFNLLAFGRITAFGSIFVDGVEYGISSAQITVDGRSADQAQLQVGQIVTVQGTGQANSTTATAATVAFVSDVIGPIAQVDTAGQAFSVLGQTVEVDSSTVFGDAIQPAGLGGLQAGMAVDVSAFQDASGDLHASRVDLHVAGSPLQVKGTIAALDTSAHTFQINDLTVNYSGVQVSGNLSNASTALVQATAPASGGVLYATQVQVSSGIGGKSGQNGQMEGLVTNIASSQQFSVGEQVVQTNSGTHFVLHGQPLAPNLEVTIHGTFDASGVLVADQVHAAPPNYKAQKAKKSKS
jgi:hypothetical protein